MYQVDLCYTDTPPHLNPNDVTYTPIDDEHTSSVKKLKKKLDPRSDSENESDRDIESMKEPKLIQDRESNSSSSSSSSSSHLSMFIPRTVYMATSTRQSPLWLIDSGAAISVLVHTITSPTVSTVTSRSHLLSNPSSVQLQKASSTTLSSVLWVSEFFKLMICITSFCQYIRYVQAVTTIRNKWVCSLMRGVDFSRLIHAGMPSSCSLTRSRRSMAWLITEYTCTLLMPTSSPHSSQ